MMTASDRSAIRRACYQILAGGTAGLAEVILMHPLDVVKTRLQLQTQASPSKPSATHYSGVADCFAKMYRHEGFSSYWKGLLPPVLSDTPKRAIKFLVYEQAKSLFLFGSSKPTATTYLLAGGTAGTLEAFVINPFEVVKVTQQANREKRQLSTSAVASDIVHREGFGTRGLYRGLTATMARNGIFHLLYFGFYYGIRDVWLPLENSTWEYMRRLGIAFVAGFLGSVLDNPFDVAKSRIQAPQPNGRLKYKTTLSTIRLVYQEEGFAALCTGILPKIMRVGPGGAILLIAYEYLYDCLLLTYG